MLEFRSSAQKVQTLVIVDDDGTKRTVTARCVDPRTGRWDINLDDPANKRLRTVNANDKEISVMMSAMAAQYEPEYRQSKSRDHRPAPGMLPDRAISKPLPPITFGDRDNRFTRR